MKKKAIVFVTNRFEIGGTENEIVRWCNSLHRRNISTELLLIQNKIDQSLLALLPSTCTVNALTNYKGKMSYVVLPFVVKKNIFSNDKLYHITDAWSLFFFVLNAKRGAPYNIGIYHRNEFIFEGKLFLWFKDLINTNKKGLIVANNTISTYYEKEYGLKDVFIQKPLTLIKDFNSKHDVSILNKSIDVLIVSRLVYYKKYLKTTLKALQSFEKPLNVVIVGDGPLMSDYQRDFPDFEFTGTKSYDDVKRLMIKSKVFIGNGTAMLQGVLNGTCCIVAPDSLSDIEGFYGFAADIDFKYSYTEDLYENQKRRHLHDLLSIALNNIQERSRIVDDSIKKVTKYLSIANSTEAETNFLALGKVNKLALRLSVMKLIISEIINSERLK